MVEIEISPQSYHCLKRCCNPCLKESQSCFLSSGKHLCLQATGLCWPLHWQLNPAEDLVWMPTFAKAWLIQGRRRWQRTRGNSGLIRRKAGLVHAASPQLALLEGTALSSQWKPYVPSHSFINYLDLPQCIWQHVTSGRGVRIPSIFGSERSNWLNVPPLFQSERNSPAGWSCWLYYLRTYIREDSSARHLLFSVLGNAINSV